MHHVQNTKVSQYNFINSNLQLLFNSNGSTWCLEPSYRAVPDLILGTKKHSLFLTLKGKEARWKRARDTFEYLFQVFHF